MFKFLKELYHGFLGLFKKPKKALAYKPIAKKSKYHSTWERHKAQDCKYNKCWYCLDEAN